MFVCMQSVVEYLHKPVPEQSTDEPAAGGKGASVAPGEVRGIQQVRPVTLIAEQLAVCSHIRSVARSL